MKKLNKLLAIILAITMIMSLAVVVQADSFTITVKPESGATVAVGETYYAYKIFDAEASGSTYIYKINEDNYFWETIKSLSTVYDSDGTTVLDSTSGTYFKLTKVSGSSPTTYIVESTEYTTENGYLAAAVVSALKAKADADTDPYHYAASGSITTAGGNASITVNEAGYYFITTTVGSAVVVGTYANAVEVDDKNETPTVDKTVYDTTGATYDTNSKSNNAQIGDTVYFQTKITKIDEATDLVLHDLMEAGLSFDSTSVSIKLYHGASAGTETTLTVATGSGTTDYIVDTTNNYYRLGTLSSFDSNVTYYTYDASSGYTQVVDTSGGPAADTVYYRKSTFDIDFDLSNYSDLNEDSYIIVSYSATLTGAGVEIYSETNDNETYVSYGDSSYTTTSLTTTKTYPVTIFKYYLDGVTETALSGAGFKIYYTDGSGQTQYLVATSGSDQKWTVTGTTTTVGDATVFTTDSSGYIYISGLDSDTTYSLTEVTTPTGYNPLTSDIEFTISSTDGTVSYSSLTDQSSIKVLNSAGKNMPTTGGIGTTIFYIVGGVLVVGAIVLLITKKRIGKDGE